VERGSGALNNMLGQPGAEKEWQEQIRQTRLFGAPFVPHGKQGKRAVLLRSAEDANEFRGGVG
jgi:hypothetical protein